MSFRYKGEVQFEVNLGNDRLRFPHCTFSFPSPPAGVGDIELEATAGDKIECIVHLLDVASPDDGAIIASEVIEAVLNRLAFVYGTRIENAHERSRNFSILNPPPGGLVLATSKGNFGLNATGLTASITISPSDIVDLLEKKSVPGEEYFGLFRSARQSTNHVEEFMHLYQLLLMFLEDDQSTVDAFIRRHLPHVNESPMPPIKRKKKPKSSKPVQETIFTRLRNEFAHRRDGVDIKQTKQEMEEKVGTLRDLIKKAIEELNIESQKSDLEAVTK